MSTGKKEEVQEHVIEGQVLHLTELMNNVLKMYLEKLQAYGEELEKIRREALISLFSIAGIPSDDWERCELTTVPGQPGAVILIKPRQEEEQNG